MSETSQSLSADSKTKLWVILLKVICAYLVLSTITIPFFHLFWIGELAVLAVIQLPKILFAHWLRTDVVMQAIKLLGLSKESHTPDLILAGPYALALAYLIPIAILMGISWWRTHMARPCAKWALILLALALLDFFFTLAFSDRPGISIY